MGKIKYIEDLDLWKKEFHFFHLVTVRFSETDLFGHMNNTVPFIYFEEARIEFLQNAGVMQEWIKPESDAIPVAADLQCDFLKQVYFGEKLKIYVKIQQIGTSSADLHYMCKKEDNSICFVGRGALVQISKQSGRAVPWTEKMRTLLLGNGI